MPSTTIWPTRLERSSDSRLGRRSSDSTCRRRSSWPTRAGHGNNSLQLNLLKRVSNGVQFNISYTYSRSMDTSSSDPGSTSGGGKPDVPNTGFVVQGNQRDLDANYARSDFDRPHRISGSFMWDLPGTGILDGFRVSGFVQLQSGLPYSIYAAEPEINSATVANGQYSSVRLGSGGCTDWDSDVPACAALSTS